MQLLIANLLCRSDLKSPESVAASICARLVQVVCLAQPPNRYFIILEQTKNVQCSRQEKEGERA